MKREIALWILFNISIPWPNFIWNWAFNNVSTYYIDNEGICDVD